MEEVLWIILAVIISFLYLRQGRKILKICDDWQKRGALLNPWRDVLFPRAKYRWQLLGQLLENKKDTISCLSNQLKNNWVYACLIVFFWLPLVVYQLWIAFWLRLSLSVKNRKGKVRR